MKLLTELLPHQREAVTKLSKIKVGALYLEQGTGKTRTTLSLIQPRLEKGKVDVILWLCPCSVKKNLKEDLAYHCGEMPEEIVVRGIESLSSSDRLYMMLLRLVTTHRVFLVVDESNLVKNQMAIRTERIIELSKHCQYKLILNGTPISKNEADLFAQWYILDWRILGYKSFYSFAANHLEYRKIRLPNGREVVDRKKISRVLNVDYLSEKIAPYTYQVKKEDCLKIPDKRYYRTTFWLTDKQSDMYQDVRGRYLLNVDELKPETIYKFFTALQHVTSGREVLTDPEKRMETRPVFENPKDNPRIRALLGILDDQKTIIFCKYQSEVDELMKLLPNSVEFTGRIPQKQRQANRERFRKDAQFLIANKSCGAYGLNLQFCHKVIFYNNDFDLATRLQAEDRVHRIGQTHEVEIIDICAMGTIDDFITDCLVRKENLAEAFKEQVGMMKSQKFGKFGRINIGFSRAEKEAAIDAYRAKHPEIENVIIFYPDKWEHLEVHAEYTPYSEIIMYRTYYPYLQKIDNSYLIVYDECMRDKNRKCLTYNCAHKYNNQTEHVLVFEAFPFIDDAQDFMILADMVDYVRMHGRKFDVSVLDDIPTVCRYGDYVFSSTPVEADSEAYEKKKTELFDNLGKKDPDTIPNALEIFVGKWKKPEFDKEYVARNSRYKGDNVSTYAQHKSRKEVCLIDLPLRTRDFTDWLKLSGCQKMTFLHTGLPVDNFFYNKYQKWFEEVKNFVEAAGLHEGDCG